MMRSPRMREEFGGDDVMEVMRTRTGFVRAI
jgi:hypothetical protein